jgi:5'-nucleotidase
VRILLTNDDGVYAPGLATLAAAFPGDEVWVVAPDREQSASSHSISLHRPLRVVEVAPRATQSTARPRTPCKRG